MSPALDHVAVVVRDVDATTEAFARLLGLEPAWRGGDGGARHAWFQLPDMALDVIAPDGEGAFGDRLRARLDSHGEGMWALAFTVPDVAASAKLMSRRGLAATEPGPVRSTAPDGARRYWTTSSLDPETTAGLQILLCAPPRDPAAWAPSTPSGPAPVTRLDHVVVASPNADRALGIYGAKLGLDLRLDRSNPQWGARQLFFAAGPSVVEIGASLKTPALEAPDRFGGLAWRVADADAAQARLAAAGFNVSEVRTGRKPGTRVFTVRDAPAALPTLMIQQDAAA